jgi:hypothetical protein
MRRKLLLGMLLAAWFAAVAWFVATPYLSVWSLTRAAKAGDADGIAAHVDFPALRESLQANAAQSIKDLSSAFPNNPLAQMGASLATTLAQNAIVTAVTPETVALMLHGVPPDGPPIGSPIRAGDFNLSMGYSAFSRFVVEAKRSGSDGSPLQLIFARSGITDWRLTSVRW